MLNILLILTQILAFIKINGGMNYTWEEDEQDSYFRLADFSGEPPSPGEEMFRELFGTPADQVNTEIQGESSTAEIRNVPMIEKTRDTRDQDSCFQNNDFSGEPPSPSEEIFPERFSTPVNQINKEIHGESSTAEIQNVPADKNTRETWAQDIFLQEYKRMKKYQSWNDLRNDAYVESWPIFCHQLWDKHPNMKRGQICSATRFYESLKPNYNYRVVITNNYKRYRVDLLKCKCPKNSSIPSRLQTVSDFEIYFFVTPCAGFNNSYYIMRKIRHATLEVFDIRNTTFCPAFDTHVRTTETNVQSYGQPGITGIQIVPKDETENIKFAQKNFLEEFGFCEMRKPWYDLRNKAYKTSLPKLCFQLLDNESSKWTGEDCKTTPLHKKRLPYMRHRVVDPRFPDKRMYADLLLCDCPKSAPFYVTKSFTGKNSYYLIRLKGNYGSDLEVYDLRNVSFN